MEVSVKKDLDTPVDFDRFASLLAEADRAYRLDVSYAIAVCGAARSIESKREVWKLRLELRSASKTAQLQCRKVTQFKCDNTSPCGLGDCKFAQGEMALLHIQSPGHTMRPQVDSQPSYGLEGAVESLRQLRSSSTDQLG